jgi:hypothetical protein
MKSHPFPKIPTLLVTIPCLFAASALAADKKAPPVKPAPQYAAFDTHANEHLTIAAEPCDDPKDCDFFRLPYIQHGFIAVRVIFTNDGDTALSLDDARIQFISANNDVIPAANDDDLQRRLFSTQSVKGRKIPLPLPLPPITLHDKPVDKQISKDDADFGFSSSIVKPHSTLDGYLFYDVRQLNDMPLKNAQIYVKEVYTVAGKENAKKQLFPFTIPFNKWLAAQPGAKAVAKQQQIN